MDSSIVLFLVQDAVINGAIYALVAVALLLVFAVTRVILVPQGEFVAFSALTLAALQAGKPPATVWLLLVALIVAGAFAARAAEIPSAASGEYSTPAGRCAGRSSPSRRRSRT